MENYSNLTTLEQALLCCRACHLRQDCIGPTSFNGTPDSPLMLVGEGPGGVEDEYGTPLVGPSGQLLDKALWAVGVTRDRVYTTNVIKCRPKYNRTPTVEEGRFCADQWLRQEIALVKPRVIVALGSVALKYLYGPAGGIKKQRGQWFTVAPDIPAVATYHPAYLLRLTGRELVAAKWEVFYDLQAAVAKVRELAPHWELKGPAPFDLLAAFRQRRDARAKRPPA